MSRLAIALALLCVAAPALVACGDDDSERTAAPQGETAMPSPAAELPSELSGTWKATLRRWELADPPDDLTAAKAVGKLKFLGTGGIDNGPSMYFEHRELGEVVNPVAISGDHITLQTPTPCQVFSYAVEAGRLRLSSVEPGCPSTAVSSVLTARPWKRTAN